MSQPIPFSIGLTIAHNAIQITTPMMIITALINFVIMR